MRDTRGEKLKVNLLIAGCFALQIACGPWVPIEYVPGLSEGDASSSSGEGSVTSGDDVTTSTMPSGTTSMSGPDMGGDSSEPTDPSESDSETTRPTTGDPTTEDPTDAMTTESTSTTSADPECGNGIVEEGEECDDDNEVDNDDCLNSCLDADCGDGVVRDHESVAAQDREVCDRGEGAPQDTGCAADCSGVVMRVFVTSSYGGGDFGGVEGAHDECNKLAQDQDALQTNGLGGPSNFKAWIAGSDASSAPAESFKTHDGPYVRMDGEVVANSWDDLTDGELIYPISITEQGEVSPQISLVWTNVTTSGARENSDGHCTSWSYGEFDRNGLHGAPSEVDVNWTSDKGFTLEDFWSENCAWPKRLYCFEQSPEMPDP